MSCASSISQNLRGLGNPHPLEIELLKSGTVECLSHIEHAKPYRHSCCCHYSSTCGETFSKAAQYVHFFFWRKHSSRMSHICIGGNKRAGFLRSFILTGESWIESAATHNGTIENTAKNDYFKFYVFVRPYVVQYQLKKSTLQ